MLEKLSRFVQDRFIRSRKLNSTRLVVVSFLVMILVGALLLTLPISSRTGESVGFFTALFTATSSTCVTGLVVADTFLTWSPFGQGVILLLIQLGGLGFMTVITLLSFAFHRRIGLSERLIMVSTLNLDDLDGVVRVVRHALMGTAFFELCGAALLSLRMIPKYGLIRGLWHALFHSVSAFCNAGFDLQGGDTGAFSSLSGFADDPVVLLTTSALVIVGGLGFFVWEDIYRNRAWKKLTLYSKLVLAITAFLLLGGTLFFFFAEGNNPATLGSMPLGEKWLNAFFQSMTLRTAGFNVIDQGAMTDNSLVMSCILMLIGGSSGSTAGGVKTATVAVLLLALRASLTGREQVAFRGRAVPFQRVLDAMTLALVVLFLFFGASMTISTLEGLPYLDCAYEVASAMGTAGLTCGLTPGLSRISQGLIIALMYLGRVGILSFSIAFITRNHTLAKLRYPEMRVMIG